MVPGRKRSTNDEATFPSRKLTKNDNVEMEKLDDLRGIIHYGKETKWVSPVDKAKQGGRTTEEDRRHHSFLRDSLSKLPNSSSEADFNGSMISLDFGLISPRRNWSSPPQRIERAENREWYPHRVVDRPNPEGSPGNWISMKESCQQSLPTEDIRNDGIEFVSPCTAQEQRSASQSTYVLSAKGFVPVSPRVESRPTRKTCVLSDYQPDRSGSIGVPPWKKSSANPAESKADNKNFPVGDKVRRIADPGGRVVKISLLDDFQIPGYGKVSIERNAEETEKENFQGEPQGKITKGRLNSMAKSKNSSKTVKLISSIEKAKKKEETKEKKQETRKNEEAKEEKENDDKTDNLVKGTQDMIKDLENILRDKESVPLKKEVVKVGKRKSKPNSFPPKAIDEEIPPAVAAAAAAAEKRKRKIDAKGVQEFIRNQKLKRLEQVKTEKKSKVEEKEAIKKKLEELRLKTLKLAAQSKKKKSSESAVKIVETVTEDDVTMSLGLKQVKPKLSYNESISNLKRKIPQAKSQQTKSEVEIAAENEESNREEEDQGKVEVGENAEIDRLASEKPTEIVQPLVKPPPEVPISLNVTSRSNLNSTLKKLAEVLHMKIEEKEKQFRSRPTSVTSKSVKDSPTRVISEESVNKTVEGVADVNPQTVTVNLETIQTLREDIKKISENFNVLHRIIVENANLNESKAPEKKGDEKLVEAKSDSNFLGFSEKPPGIPQWQKNILLRPYPYNVYTAMRRKMNLGNSKSTSSVTSQGSSTYAETISNKCDSNFEALSLPSYRLRSVKPITRRKRRSSKSTKTTANSAEENYFGSKDSGSEFSSSILDSDKNTISSVETNEEGKISRSLKSAEVQMMNDGSNSKTSSAITEITSKNLRSPSLKESDSLKISPVNFDEDRRSLVLVTPDVKLISSELTPKKLNNSTKNVNLIQDATNLFSRKSSESKSRQELNNSGEPSKSESTITEIIDNLTGENEKVEKNRNSVRSQANEVINIRRSYFQPEMLHLQFQAELILLETFQQSLSQFLEAERMKTLSEVTKIVYEKSVNTEKQTEKEDQAVQTSFLQKETDEDGSSEEDEADSVTTEINISDDAESVKSEKIVSSINRIEEVEEEDLEMKDDEKTTETSGKLSRKETSINEEIGEVSNSREKDGDSKESETPDFASEPNGISFQMLNRMMKDEELRSEHQLALIRLREKTLNEKVKAELTFLEMKKRALKEGVSNEDQNVSAIKKRQRGILMKYQSEKEEIERLKKMHKIASEERKIMIKQQKQIQQMQLSTKDMLTKLRRREKSPPKKSPLKLRTLKSYDSQSEIQEDIPIDPLSDSILTESVCSLDNSNDLDVSTANNASDEEKEFLKRRNKNGMENQTIKSKNLSDLMETDKHPGKGHSVEELLSWTKRLEEKENRLKQLERETIGSEISTRNKIGKQSKNVKMDRSTKDRSTSPFNFPEGCNSFGEISSYINETVEEAKKSSTISEDIPEVSYKTKTTEKTMQETVTGNCTSSDIPIQYSKTIGSTSRNLEYNSQSFESPSSSETPKARLLTPRSKSVGVEGSYKSIPIKLSLSPRIQSPRRRYSSGSDDSLNLSHTETASEQSDLESRIAALHEQLRKRKLEAERLRREQKKVQKERLKVKEQSLIKQIQAYDAYIQKKKQELEQEYERSHQAISRPAIKQPKAAEKANLKRQEYLLLNESDRIRFHPRIHSGETKETERCATSRKASESDSEIPEQIDKDAAAESIAEEIKISDGNQEKSESIRELQTESARDEQTESVGEIQTESIKEEQTVSTEERKTEEEKEFKDGESIVEMKTISSCETSETVKPSSIAPEESLTETRIDLEASLSESEEHSASIKTTVHSPEKPDTETVESQEGTEPIQDVEEKNAGDDSNDKTYQSDSFESDFEEIGSKVSQSQQKSELSEVETDISVEAPSSAVEEEEEEEEKKENEKQEKKDEEVEKQKEEKFKEISVISDEVKSVGGGKSVDGGESVAAEETPKTRNKVEEERLEAISDSIILDLLTDSLKLFSARKSTVEKRSKEAAELNLGTNLSNRFLSEILTETIDGSLKLYDRKQKRKATEDKMDSDTGKKNGHEASPSVENQEEEEGKMQETGVAEPTETTLEDAKENISPSMNSTGKDENSIEIFPLSESNHQRNKNKIFGQEWLEDDFGLSRTRREAEELRLQQLQIEQEIQQLQSQRDHIPYFYLREIPNKPPPPYTPPAKPLSEIPTTESEVLAVTSLAVRIIAEEISNGRSDFGGIEPDRDYFGNLAGEHVRCYKFFLFDLAKHIVQEVVSHQEKRKEVSLPWEKIRETLSACRYYRIERTSDRLNEFVQKQVLLLFGFNKRAEKESLMMRCFKKKRDHVDEILVSESQEEESDWTRFDEDQVSLKNELTLAILDDLLEESTRSVKVIFGKKMKGSE